MTVVNLNVVKWLALCDAAEVAVTRVQGVEDLAVMAGRLTTVTATPHSLPDTSLVTSFRWDCSAFGLAGPRTRLILAPGLLAKAALVRRLLTPTEPEGQAALAAPTPELETDTAPRAWTQRADIWG